MEPDFKSTFSEAWPALRPVRQPDAFWIPVCLAVITVLLAGLHIAVDKGHHAWPDLVSAEALRFVDLGLEANLPTWFTSMLWVTAAFVAYSIWRVTTERGDAHRGYWVGMVPLFVFLSIDEAGKVHEAIGEFIGGFADFSGFFTYAWVIFGLGFVAVVGGVYFRFLLLLKPEYAVSFVLAALVFLAGAVGVESIWAAVDKGHLEQMPLGQSHLRMIIYEETLEMFGAILLLRTLLRVQASRQSPYRPLSTPQFAQPAE